MWIVFTLAAVLLWAFVNIADSYLVERNKKLGHPIGSLVLFSSIFAFVVSIIIYVFIGDMTMLSWANKILLIVAGFCNLLWVIFYFYALIDNDISSIIPWFLLVPVFGYILGYLILGETLGAQQIFGGIIIFLGGIILSVKRNPIKENRRYHIKWKPIVYMSIASLLIAVWGVVFKFVARDVGFWESSFWEHIGLTIAGGIVLVCVKSYRIGFLTMLRTGGAKLLCINIFSEIATIVGNLFSNYALLLVPVTLVYLVQIAQPAIVCILGVMCTVCFPYILKEDISKRNLIHKGISVALMTIGAIVLFL